MTRPCGGVSHARIGGTRRPLRGRGRRSVSPYPIDRRLWRCIHSGTQHRSRPLGRTCVVGSLFPAPGAYLCPWLAGPCASPPSGGHGCPCARPLEAATGRSRAVQDERRCGGDVRGVRAAQQRGEQSKRNASSIMMSSKKSHRNAYRKSHDVVHVIHVDRAAKCS